jgi:GxxExxY protein
MGKEIIHKELSYKLNGIFYYIQNHLGRYCSHKQYADATEILFKEKRINYEREVGVPIEFSGSLIKGNRIDFLIERLIPIDIKTEKYVTKADFIQMRRYLKATNRRLGIIVNFRERTLKPKRVVNSSGEI